IGRFCNAGAVFGVGGVVELDGFNVELLHRSYNALRLYCVAIQQDGHIKTTVRAIQQDGCVPPQNKPTPETSPKS
ncbi:MAG TPA: hypothetical protein PK299_16005, partial [Anaerolineales bacterium]|nr:hypothetical protein [Anaerolineales bacterium]